MPGKKTTLDGLTLYEKASFHHAAATGSGMPAWYGKKVI
jgi:hypothetical protein